ncbi:MAG TPA: hypothetical protein VIH69_05000 [Dehalococcoidia bacterium]
MKTLSLMFDTEALNDYGMSALIEEACALAYGPPPRDGFMMENDLYSSNMLFHVRGNEAYEYFYGVRSFLSRLAAGDSPDYLAAGFIIKRNSMESKMTRRQK